MLPALLRAGAAGAPAWGGCLLQALHAAAPAAGAAVPPLWGPAAPWRAYSRSSRAAAAGAAPASAFTHVSSMTDPLPAMAEPLPIGLAVDEIFIDHDAAFSAAETPASGQLHDEAPITAIFLHGLLGSSRNWRSFARRLAQEAAARASRDVRVLLVDLRCHGASASRFGMHPPHDLASAANDVAEVVRSHLGGAAPHLVVGLSLGGKVALQLLKQFAANAEAAGEARGRLYDGAPPIAPPGERPGAAGGGAAAGAGGGAPAPPPTPAEPRPSLLGPSAPALHGMPQQVWVLDSQPGTVPLDVDAPTSVGKIISLIHQIPTPLESRAALSAFLTARGIPLAVAQWLGTSLTPGGRYGNPEIGLDWVFDVQGAAALYNSYRLSSYWDVMSRPPPGVVVHMVRGELSDRWTPGMIDALADAHARWAAASSEAPESVGELQLHTLERAGHWLQADNPEGLHALMEPCPGADLAALRAFRYTPACTGAPPEALLADAAGCACGAACSAAACACAAESRRGLDALAARGRGAGVVVLLECGPACSCGPGCAGRTTQGGVVVPLVLTWNAGKGWCVRAQDAIPQGEFVCEYAGEWVGRAEAAAHLASYDAQGGGHALLVVRVTLPSGAAALTCRIDGTRAGNVARFVNHDCAGGNLEPVVVSSRGALLPRVALFAARRIAAGEELTFSYAHGAAAPADADGAPRAARRCCCGAEGCSGFLPATR
ncbi:SUVR3 [Scenedesmus sp. PABB004]|nr:SUVR3 [Scenedesmus sp. PABB004]